MDSQTPEFIELKDTVIKKKDQIYVSEKELRNLNSDLKNQINKLQNICKHDYIEECATSDATLNIIIFVNIVIIGNNQELNM